MEVSVSNYRFEFTPGDPMHPRLIAELQVELQNVQQMQALTDILAGMEPEDLTNPDIISPELVENRPTRPISQNKEPKVEEFLPEKEPIPNPQVNDALAGMEL